ncbi:Efflux pump FUS6 [Colletotrichum sp. SAR 10_96]|nr:Efflux pump FUS6 [Colletotrichum sp. SAR 10_96]
MAQFTDLGTSPVTPYEPLQTLAAPQTSNDQQIIENDHAEAATPWKTQGWRFWAVFPGLCLAMLLTGLDAFILATSLPTIVSDLHGGALYIWTMNGYFLTTAVVQPLMGQAADRRIPMLVALSFTLGSFLGPIIGGAIVDNTTWRWVFYINLPICAVALLLVFLFLRVNHKREGTIAQQLGRVDYSGNFILVYAVVSILIPLTWGGTTYSWKSWHILLSLLAGFTGLVLFGVHQGKFAREPTMPLRVYSNVSCALGYGITFLHGIVLSWLSFFLPVYFQILLESTPLQSGVKLLAVVIPLAPAGMAGGIAIAVTGHYKMVIVAGFVLLSIAVGCMTTLYANSSTAIWIVFQVLAGLGGGLSLTATLPAVQAPVPESDVAIATAAWAFARSFGAIWGATIPSAVFNSRFDELLHLISEPSVRDLLAHGGAYEHAIRLFIKQFDAQPVLKEQIIHVYTEALKRVWIVLIPFAVVPIGLALCIKEVELRQELKTDFGLKETSQTQG